MMKHQQPSSIRYLAFGHSPLFTVARENNKANFSKMASQIPQQDVSFLITTMA